MIALITFEMMFYKRKKFLKEIYVMDIRKKKKNSKNNA